MSIAKGVGKGIAKSVAKKKGRPKIVEDIFASGFKDFGKTTSKKSLVKKMPENKEELAAVKRKLSIVKTPTKKTETKIATVSDLKKMSSTQISKLKSKTVSTLNSKTKLKEFADKKSINLTTARNRLKTGLSNINKVTEDKKKTTKKPTTTVVAKKTRKPDPKKKTTTSVTIVTASGRKEPRLGTASVSRIDTALNKYKSKFAKARTNEEYLRIAKEMKKDPIFKGNPEKVKNLIAKSKPKGTGRLYIGAVRGTGKGTGKVAAVGGGGGGTLFTIGLAAGNSKKRKKKA